MRSTKDIRPTSCELNQLCFRTKPNAAIPSIKKGKPSGAGTDAKVALNAKSSLLVKREYQVVELVIGVLCA